MAFFSHFWTQNLKENTFFIDSETILAGVTSWTCTLWREVYCEETKKWIFIGIFFEMMFVDSRHYWKCALLLYSIVLSCRKLVFPKHLRVKNGLFDQLRKEVSFRAPQPQGGSFLPSCCSSLGGRCQLLREGFVCCVWNELCLDLPQAALTAQESSQTFLARW